MDNPWTAIGEHSWTNRECILDMDREAIAALNARVSKEALRIQVNSLPEPFIGNPETARIVFLGLNPAHSPRDAMDYERSDFRAALIRNLHHKPQAYPFYPLSPDFKDTGAGGWWRQILRRLLDDSGLDESLFAERILAIEWFPYHSKQGPHLQGPIICQSQRYSFELARRLRESGKLLLMLRSRSVWANSVEGFREVPELMNRQRTWISPGNMSFGLYQQILEELRRAPR